MVRLLAVMGLVAGLAAPAGADDWFVDGYVGGVSDLRDRGLSLSGGDPAFDGSLMISHADGAYLGLQVGLFDSFAGDLTEKDELFVGYRTDWAGHTLDFSVEMDSYHQLDRPDPTVNRVQGAGGRSRFFPEIKASLSRDLGLFYVRLATAYAPSGRWSAPDAGDSLFVGVDLEVPVPTRPSLTVIGKLGYDMISESRVGDRRISNPDRLNWGVGLSYFIGDAEITALYEDTDLSGPEPLPESAPGGGTIVLGLRYYF
ncbi:TorF family putative porin [Yunchengibacter salinarum]|uniref:TorF family putative porin n=1 Tax=Yunchengibacter salinarum TaxID=3133399 RepID=UPI0035B5C51F